MKDFESSQKPLKSINQSCLGALWLRRAADQVGKGSAFWGPFNRTC